MRLIRIHGRIAVPIQMVENSEGAKKINNPDKLTTYGTQNDQKQTNAQHTMCCTPLYANKHK